MNWRVVLALAISLPGLSNPVRADDASLYASERAVFQAAWTAAGRGDIDALEDAIEAIPDYPLTPYLQFELKRQQIDRQGGPEMERFLARFRDWSFADRLEQQWLTSLGQAGRNADLLRYGEPARDVATQCRLAAARLANGDTGGLEARIRAAWLSPKSQPKACDPLFSWWKRQGNPDIDTAWQRFGLAIEAGETQLARYLRRYLAPTDRMLADGWLKLADRTAAGLADARAWPDQPRARQLVAWGLHRLAGNDWQRASALLEGLERTFSFTGDEIGPVRRRIALFQAVDLEAEAIDSIDALGSPWVDQQMLEWRLRAALANGLWSEALNSIQRMPAEQQLRERWRYWRARALAELDRPAAGLVYATLATEADYYGFLAALQSNQPLTLCSRDIQADGDVQRRLLRDAEFERANELFHVGLAWHARWTWNRVSRRLSNAELQQAALLAAAIGWHDRAIHALGQARSMDAYPWRFPMIERERIQNESRRHGIDPALVMGLMRAESAMQADARSPAGARGLLQLMDGTAREVARRNKLAYKGPADLYEPDKNIALGTAHLGELNRRFSGDWTLVAAAYNAGISSAERWRRERPDLPGDIWLETLPFFETRDYVPRVLAFATVYEWQLGRRPEVLANNLLENSPEKTAFGCPTSQAAAP
ncbi:MAG: transglycosylase SLT domain-containing protein [Wenzhouxiangellaceae bacterium]|nr:transglycosylase SLT domain-containing protein [Wenzhouxiangellaceae bacterium]